MFGYVKPYNPELRVRELEEYKAVYCGLCKQLGRSFGVFARFTLSYDFAFLAMLKTALDSEICPETERCACIAHPFCKRIRVRENAAMQMAARTAMISVYYKLLDDRADEGFFRRIGAALLLPFAKRARRKALAFADGAAADEAAGAQTAVPFLPGHTVRHEGRGDGRGAGFFAFGVETDAKGRKPFAPPRRSKPPCSNASAICSGAMSISATRWTTLRTIGGGVATTRFFTRAAKPQSQQKMHFFLLRRSFPTILTC